MHPYTPVGRYRRRTIYEDDGDVLMLTPAGYEYGRVVPGYQTDAIDCTPKQVDNGLAATAESGNESAKAEEKPAPTVGSSHEDREGVHEFNGTAAPAESGNESVKADEKPAPPRSLDENEGGVYKINKRGFKFRSVVAEWERHHGEEEKATEATKKGAPGFNQKGGFSTKLNKAASFKGQTGGRGRQTALVNLKSKTTFNDGNIKNGPGNGMIKTAHNNGSIRTGPGNGIIKTAHNNGSIKTAVINESALTHNGAATSLAAQKVSSSPRPYSLGLATTDHNEEAQRRRLRAMRFGQARGPLRQQALQINEQDHRRHLHSVRSAGQNVAKGNVEKPAVHAPDDRRSGGFKAPKQLGRMGGKRRFTPY
jgi:hypothetical protein